MVESIAAEDSMLNVRPQGVHSNTLFTCGKCINLAHGLILASRIGAWAYNCHRFIQKG